MNSSTLRIGIIEQLPRRGDSSNPRNLKGSYFRELVRQVNAETKAVEEHWDDLPEDYREDLRKFAVTSLTLNNDRSGKTQHLTWKQRFRKLRIKLSIYTAIFTGQLDDVLETGFAVSQLVNAIMDAIEREEEGVTALFLDHLWEDVNSNPSKLVPYTEEMDAELEKLLAGVEVD